jgi:hypothetical protein
VKAVLTRFTPYKGIGLYIGEHEVFVSQVASTPFGSSEIAHASEPYEPDKLAETVTRLIAPLARSRRRACSVTLGLCPRRVFYSTRPTRVESAPAEAQTLLREVLQSPNVCIDEMTVEMQTSEFGKSKLNSVVSCRTDYLAGLLKALQKCGVRPQRTEPAPLALLRAGVQKRRTRRSTIAIRLFLSDHEAIAVVTAAATCVLWKSFSLPTGRELPTICSSIRSCQAMAARCGIDSQSDVAIIHGRKDLREALAGGDFAKQAGLPVVCCDGPELNGAAVAYGLALSSLAQQTGQGLDLSRSLTPAPSLWQIFPKGELAVQLALVACMALIMVFHWRSLADSEGPLRGKLAQHSWVGSKTQAELNKEQQFLSKRVEAIRKFADTRIIWTRYTADISNRLPDHATLLLLQGIYELEDPRSKIPPKKSYTIRAQSPIPQDGSTPKQIDQLLAGLRESPLLQQDFPVVGLSDIKCPPVDKKNEISQAMFTVICLPKSGTSSAASGPEQPAKEGHK